MKLSFHIAILATVCLGSPTPSSEPQKISVGYSLPYDNPDLSLNYVICSNGENGLLTKGYSKVSDIESYPDVGSVYTIGGWDSPNCGKCYELRYKNRVIFFTAIDRAESGAYVSKAALDQLTGGRAYEAGRVDAFISPAPQEKCKSRR